MDTECYIRDCPLDTVLDWLRGVLADVHCVESDGILIHHAQHNLVPVSIVYTEGIEAGPFCSVHCGGDTLPWNSDAEMARDAYTFTDLPVRWSTDTIEPSDWWQLNSHGERRITWD